MKQINDLFRFEPGTEQITELLIRNGAVVDSRTIDLWTSLHLAALNSKKNQ